MENTMDDPGSGKDSSKSDLKNSKDQNVAEQKIKSQKRTLTSPPADEEKTGIVTKKIKLDKNVSKKDALDEKETEKTKESKQKPHRRRMKHTLSSVLEQMEFYFGDSSMSKDRFLKTMVDNSPDGYVDLSVFANFNKLQSLHKDGISLKVLSQALSKSTVLQLNEDKTKVRRITPFKEISQEETDRRTVYVEHLPTHTNHAWLRQVFSQCGKVAYVSLPTYKTSKQIKGFAFVEFNTTEEAEKACKMLNNPEPEKSVEPPGKFPKTNKELDRLKKLVPVRPEVQQKDQVKDTAEEKIEPSRTSKDLDVKKKRKNKSKKKKPQELTDDNTTSAATATTTEVTTEPKRDGKKKKKKRKRKNSQTVEQGNEVEEVVVNEADGSKQDETKITGDLRVESKDNSCVKEGEDVNNSSSKASETTGEEAAESSKVKKRKKKKKTKTESQEQPKELPTKGVISAESTHIKVVVGGEKTKSEDHVLGRSVEKDSNCAAGAVERKLSHKERKLLRQEDIRKKRQLRQEQESKEREGAEIRQESGERKETEVDQESKDVEGAEVQTEVSGIESGEADTSKQDCPQPTSILKLKKAAEKKRVEFDPVPITTEFVEAKCARKRKKHKREKCHLRVISKKEWVSLKQEYISHQKSHMQALKESLRELRQQEMAEAGVTPKPKLENLEDAFGTKPLKLSLETRLANVEKMQFTPNVIVQWWCTHEMHRDKIRTMFKETHAKSIAYIDANEEARSGYIRFKDETSAEEFAKLSRNSTSFMARILPAEQQEEYWEKANRDRLQKLGRKKKEQGHDRIARKVFERNKATFSAKPSRIVFDDAEDAEDTLAEKNPTEKSVHEGVKESVEESST